jgi:hypothetical protein
MKSNYIYIFAIITVFFGLMRWVHYLIHDGFIQESFTNENDNTTKQTNNVDMPLTTTISCSNMCINARCSKTGHQCLTDFDCPGCQEFKQENQGLYSDPVEGNNSAGKLTTALSQNYSTLTTDIGTKSSIYNSNDPYPAQANFGENIWLKNYNAENELFNKRYKPSGLYFMPKYPQKYSLTGTFIEDGPLSSNS